jgi:hypothetical protein
VKKITSESAARLEVAFPRRADMDGALRRSATGRELLAWSPAVHWWRGPVVLVVRFADGTHSLTLKGAVAWCRKAPAGARARYEVAVQLAAAIAEKLQQVSPRESGPSRVRRFPRHAISLLVAVHNGPRAASARMVEVSRGGARVAASPDALPDLDAKLTLDLIDPRLRYFMRPIHARVCWVKASPAGGAFGVKFERIDPTTAGVLDREVKAADQARP